MIHVAGLAFPFFGLIVLGFLAGRFWRRDENAIAWLNIFAIYFALPALFFQLISRTPVEELANGRFVATTMLATLIVFFVGFAFVMISRRAQTMAEATIQGLVGGYGNIGYMGPPLALVALGPPAAVPAALIFCFDIALVFTLTPLMMAIAGRGGEPLGRTLLRIPARVLLHPFIAASILGVLAAALKFEPPEPLERMIAALAASAAPAALFALGVTVALRPLERVPGELSVLIGIKLLLHPAIALALLNLTGDFDPVWIGTGVLMASLPPAATIYVLAVQYRSYVLRGSSAILLGTAASVVTVTGVLYLVTNGVLPGTEGLSPVRDAVSGGEAAADQGFPQQR